MKEFLSDKNLEYVEYNVEDNPEARQRMIDKSQHTIVPTVVVGEEVVLGCDTQKLADLLP
ncbi:MAG TPA: glutaredoxin domain-containing protein [Oscillospiraceae bacterium]|nr:glutaredoxin domain-containing protein [Oscillospiraceae bacterium]